MMQKMTRNLIYTIARHSNWSAAGIATWFRKENVYASTQDWIRFVRLLLLGLGGGFLVAGVIFFFAYNWADMHKFVKLGLLEFLVLAVTLAAIFIKGSQLLQKLLLTAAAVLVGVLFAVFGQIYQTGANAYDFFLGWTMCVVLWVLVARFQPLWLIFMALLNTTFIFYAQQVANHLSFPVVLDVLFACNASAILVWELLHSKGIITSNSKWFPRILALAAVIPLTMSMIMNIFDGLRPDYGASFILAAVFYSMSIWFGLRKRDLFYLSVIPFSIIVVTAAFIVRLADNDPMGMFLVASLFVIGSITWLIHNLIQFNRKWYGQS